MNLEIIEKQVLFWNKAALLAPIFVTSILGCFWFFQISDIQHLFFIACGLYFATAIIWWWWTMKSIHLILKLMSSTSIELNEVATELKSIRKEIR